MLSLLHRYCGTTFTTGKTAYNSSPVPFSCPVAYHVPIILSVHISLGACSEPVGLILPVTICGLSYIRILLNRTNFQINGNIHFCILKGLDPYIHKFVRFSNHSHLRYFIDPRRVTYSRYLYLPFRSIFLSVWVCFRRLHRAYEHLAFDRSRSEYQGRRFEALPSHSTCWTISSPNQNFTFLY